jgi:hypothetical protein
VRVQKKPACPDLGDEQKQKGKRKKPRKSPLVLPTQVTFFEVLSQKLMIIVTRCPRVVQDLCVLKRTCTCKSTTRLGYQYDLLREAERLCTSGSDCSHGFTRRGDGLSRGAWSGRCEVPQGGWALARFSEAARRRRLRQRRVNRDGRPSQPRTLLKRSAQDQRSSTASRLTSPSAWGLS